MSTFLALPPGETHIVIIVRQQAPDFSFARSFRQAERSLHFPVPTHFFVPAEAGFQLHQMNSLYLVLRSLHIALSFLRGTSSSGSVLTAGLGRLTVPVVIATSINASECYRQFCSMGLL